MKKSFIIITILFATAFCASAQNHVTVVDSLVYIPVSGLDESLVGKNIFNEVNVHQSQAISKAMAQKIERNRSKKISGYRVRIFFDNKQDSRSSSEETVNRFKSLHPGIGVYRSFASPFFKVTVGDFRTKSEALQMLQALKAEYPSSLVVKENINYPIVDKKHSYTVDTVKVTKRQ